MLLVNGCAPCKLTMQPHSHYSSGMGAPTGGSSSCINKPILASWIPHRCVSLPVSVFIEDLLCWRMMAARDHWRDVNRERQGIMARQEIKPVSIGIFVTFQKQHFSMLKFWTWCSSWRVLCAALPRSISIEVIICCRHTDAGWHRSGLVTAVVLWDVSSHIIYLCCPWIMKVTSLPDGTLAAEHYLTNSVNGKLNGLLGHEIVWHSYCVMCV